MRGSVRVRERESVHARRGACACEGVCVYACAREIVCALGSVFEIEVVCAREEVCACALECVRGPGRECQHARSGSMCECARGSVRAWEELCARGRECVLTCERVCEKVGGDGQQEIRSRWGEI